jgi:MFS family permease
MTPFIIYILCHLMVILTSISSSSVSVAFPEITSAFNTSLVVSGWVISVYQLVGVCTTVLIGKICDIYGRKKVFLACSGLFILGSLLCSIAPNIYLLILFRIIQSVGAGGLFPAITGICVDLFPHSRQRAIGFSISLFAIGGIVGPSIGAWLLTSFGWQSIFWSNVPIGILVCIPIIFLLKTNQGQKRRLDFKGAGYLTAAILAIMIGLSQVGSGKTGLHWVMTACLFAAGLIMAGLFIRHEFTAIDPIIDLELLRRKQFAAANFYNAIYGASVFGITSFIPLFAISVYKMTALQSGLILSMRSIGSIVATTIASYFTVKWGYRRPLLIGAIVVSVTVLLMGLQPRHLNILGTEIGALTILCAAFLVFGVGSGISTPSGNNACVDLMPEKAPAIAGVLGMFRQTGTAIFIPIITLLLQYTSNLEMGFQIVFFGIGLIVLATIPFILMMPSKAIVTPIAAKP